MDEKIVGAVKAAVLAALKKSGAYVDENHHGGPLVDGFFSPEDIARAAIAAHTAALAEAGFVLVPKAPTGAMRAAGEKALLIAYRSNPQWEEAKDMAEDLDPAIIYCEMIGAEK